MLKNLFVILISLVLLTGCGGEENDEQLDEITEGQNIEAQGADTSTVSYRSGGDSVSSFLAVPEGAGPFPGLIVIHEWWGLNDWIKKNAHEFASKGYVALAVDLYRGKTADNSDLAHQLSRGLPEDRAVRDLKAAYDYLQSMERVQKDAVGSIGWCMGGGYSLQTALNIPDLDACVIAYGRLVTEQSSLKNIQCPVLGIFGAEDQGIDTSDVRNFENALNDLGIENKIIIYDGVGHAFMNPNNSQGYGKEQTDEAWEKIYDFLEEYLK